MNQISLSDFRFEFSGYGHYLVTYTSPVTGKKWVKLISNMSLIDNTKNADYPKKCHLNDLKKFVKYQP